MTILNVPVTGAEVFAAIALIFVSPIVTGIIGKYKLNKSFIGGYSFGLIASIVGMVIGFVICKLLPNSIFLQAIETNGKQGVTPVTLMFVVGIMLYLGVFVFYCKKMLGVIKKLKKYMSINTGGKPVFYCRKILIMVL